MKRTFPWNFAVVLLAPIIVLAEDPAPILASSIQWMQHFGASQAAPHTTYCLMGSGFLRSPTSQDLPAVVAAWLKDHPRAVVIPVSSFGPVRTADPLSQMTYVWVVDGEQNLNVELVRNGCFDPGTQTMRKEQKLEVPQADYDAFLKKLTPAADHASGAKLGIWKDRVSN